MLHENRAASGELCLRVNGKSMAPLLLPGDRLIAQVAAAKELKPGDVIVIRDAGGFLTHRLLSVQGEYLLTKGDALLMPDPLTPLAALVGRVQTVQQAGKKPLDLRRPGWQWVQPWLAHLSWLEGQIVTRLYAAAPPPGRLQKCIARGLALPLRWLGFLLQWVIKSFSQRD